MNSCLQNGNHGEKEEDGRMRRERKNAETRDTDEDS